MENLDLTTHWAGILSVILFVAAYVAVVFEDRLHMRKCKGERPAGKPVETAATGMPEPSSARTAVATIS